MTQIRGEDILEALKSVVDPEMGVDVVNLGLVYDYEVVGEGKVKLRMTLTTMGCPAADLIEDGVVSALETIKGVGDVEIDWTFDPPWTPSRLTEEGRDQLAAFGYL